MPGASTVIAELTVIGGVGDVAIPAHVSTLSQLVQRITLQWESCYNRLEFSQVALRMTTRVADTTYIRWGEEYHHYQKKKARIR
jgi:hypothetical protein